MVVDEPPVRPEVPKQKKILTKDSRKKKAIGKRGLSNKQKNMLPVTQQLCTLASPSKVSMTITSQTTAITGNSSMGKKSPYKRRRSKKDSSGDVFAVCNIFEAYSDDEKKEYECHVCM
jgi:hypothetical protein